MPDLTFRDFIEFWQSDFSGSQALKDTALLKNERIQAQCFFEDTYNVTVPAVNTDVVIAPPVIHNGATELGVDQADNFQWTLERENTVFLTATIITSGALNDRMAFWFRKNGQKIDASKGIVRTSAPGTGDRRQCIIQCLADVEEGDVIDIVAQNQTDDTNFTISNLTAIIKS